MPLFAKSSRLTISLIPRYLITLRDFYRLIVGHGPFSAVDRHTIKCLRRARITEQNLENSPPNTKLINSVIRTHFTLCKIKLLEVLETKRGAQLNSQRPKLSQSVHRSRALPVHYWRRSISGKSFGTIEWIIMLPNEPLEDDVITLCGERHVVGVFTVFTCRTKAHSDRDRVTDRFLDSFHSQLIHLSPSLAI